VVNLAFFVLFTTKHTEVYTETTKGFLTTILCALRVFFVFSVVHLAFFVLFTTKHTEVYTETTKGFHTTILCALCVFFVFSVVNSLFYRKAQRPQYY
jgi:membrane protein CcdC involved in cytochrome C biogenesis